MNSTNPILECQSSSPSVISSTDIIVPQPAPVIDGLLSVAQRLASLAIILTFVGVAMMLAGKDFWDLLPIAMIPAVLGFALASAMQRLVGKRAKDARGIWVCCLINAMLLAGLMILARNNLLSAYVQQIYTKLTGL